MRVFNEDKTKELKEYDLEKGHLEDDELITHYDYVEEVGHWETLREYSNGGKDVQWIVEVAGVEEHDEKEPIQIYIPYTKEELHKKELNEELNDIYIWFNNYDNQVKQYERCVRLDIEYDKDIVALDNEATQKQLRIREIRSELNGK